MRSRRTKTFRDSFESLHNRLQEAVIAKYDIFKENQNDSRLHRETIQRLKAWGTFIEVKITSNYRAIAEVLNGDDYLWIFVGKHSDFEKFIMKFRR